MAILGVMVDTREPEWVQKLTFGGVPTAKNVLSSGDVHLATDDSKILVIERKTPDDFLGSLKSNRIFDQGTRMLRLSEWVYVVITGQFERMANGKVTTKQAASNGSPGHTRITGWNWDAVQGALLTLQEMGIGIVHAAGDHDFENACIRLADRERDTVHVPPAREAALFSDAQAVLASLPGIGIERTQAVLKYAGNAAWGLTWLTELNSNDPILGINDGVKRTIRRVLGLRDNETLSVVCNDGKLAERKAV